jgi:hypothetical protein
MRGWVAIFRFSPASYREAIDDFARALRLDPDLVRAKLGLSSAFSDEVVFGWSADLKLSVSSESRAIPEYQPLTEARLRSKSNESTVIRLERATRKTPLPHFERQPSFFYALLTRPRPLLLGDD